ncbi:helix-turn-helix domain-containing protein [Actinomadura violacea]|uniref:Helix-turn-helix domain-containing protein n=1 Tax=Actinomadura violacea TaxID=2819934 RepID=A0ABS3RSX8_9ACTN|nr:helix-turn-helix domain-containing protein [Actinomadura violacea]MBO2459862.1 helix-turn-helix domain-containing protein [Actinomadura violacea]
MTSWNSSFPQKRTVSRVLTASAGERLRTLRELFGLTQIELSRLSGVSQAWISKLENNDGDPGPGMLELIADATGTPVKFFDVSPSTVPLDSLRFRKTASASKKMTKRIHALYGESYRVTEQLVQDTYPAPPLPFATEDELDQEQIETLAMATREALRLAPDKPVPHLTRALERAGVAVAPISLTGPGGETPITSGKHFGVSYWGGPGEAALIGYFTGSGDRDRFTLAHELGHLVLHTFRPRCADPEREAHQFAGAFLLPYQRAVEEFAGRLTLTSLAHKKAAWGVSIQALIMRAAAVDAIDEPRRQSLFVQLNHRGWRKEEPVTVGHEHPLLLWKLLSQRYGDKPYRLASDELAIPPAILRSIAPTPAPTGPATGPRPGRVTQLRRQPLGQHGR